MIAQQESFSRDGPSLDKNSIDESGVKKNITDKNGSDGASDKKLRTRRSLTHAARDLVYERGHDKISIQDITVSAGVATGTFYNHFQTKQDVFEAVLDDFREAFAQELEEVRRNLTDPALIITATLKYYFRQAQDNEMWSSYLKFSGLPGEHVLCQSHEQCLEDIQRGAKAGRFTVDDVYFTHTLILGMVRHINKEVSEGKLGRSAMDNTVQYVLRMLGLPALVARALVQSPLPPVPAQRSASL